LDDLGASSRASTSAMATSERAVMKTTKNKAELLMLL
jgi:hypothetical protein